VTAEELLQGAYRRDSLQGNGLDTLAGQVGEQGAAVGVEVLAHALLVGAIGEGSQRSRELWTQRRHWASTRWVS
jgi:hypothetical protein